MLICITYKLYVESSMASGQYNQGSRVRPNFSRMRGRTSATSHLSKKKSLCDSESLSVVQQKTHLRLMSSSKPIRDSEGQTPPSDWPWTRYSCTCVCAHLQMHHVCCCNNTEREVISRDARSVANLARFSAFVDPHSDPHFFFQKSD